MEIMAYWETAKELGLFGLVAYVIYSDISDRRTRVEQENKCVNATHEVAKKVDVVDSKVTSVLSALKKEAKE